MVVVIGHRSLGDYRFSGRPGTKLGMRLVVLAVEKSVERPDSRACGKAGKAESGEELTYPPDSAFPRQGLILRITDAKKYRRTWIDPRPGIRMAVSGDLSTSRCGWKRSGVSSGSWQAFTFIWCLMRPARPSIV